VRVVAIDWSGRARYARRHIWLAEARGQQLVRLECGKDRDEVGDWLLGERLRREPMIIGLDFAFSMPSWFLEDRGMKAAPELWSEVATNGEEWLRDCQPPFWGRPGKKRTGDGPWLRVTDALAVSGAIGAKSVFQVGGAGAVGTGSIRGMPLLHRLREDGWSVWPFDPVAAHTLVEIYPRLLTGPVNKSQQTSRERYLSACYPALHDKWKREAAKSEDAFDAAVSALQMERHLAELVSLPSMDSPTLRREGLIWFPGLFPG
jgi:hypothetical protein